MHASAVSAARKNTNRRWQLAFVPNVNSLYMLFLNALKFKCNDQICLYITIGAMICQVQESSSSICLEVFHKGQGSKQILNFTCLVLIIDFICNLTPN